MPCGVFRLSFSSFLLLSSLFLLSSCFVSLPCLASACPFLSSLLLSSFFAFSLFGCGCCFFFPFGIYAKRKGAPCWCVLSCPVVGCFIWLRLYIPRTRKVSARLYRNKVLEKGNLIECNKLFYARRCSYLCSSKFVFLLFSYLFVLVGSYFLFPFGYMFSASLIAASFAFENIHPAPHVR